MLTVSDCLEYKHSIGLDFRKCLNLTYTQIQNILDISKICFSNTHALKKIKPPTLGTALPIETFGQKSKSNTLNLGHQCFLLGRSICLTDMYRYVRQVEIISLIFQLS